MQNENNKYLNHKVTALIVTYNRLELLKECISALLNQTTSIESIVIVNNNSTDGTGEFLEKFSINQKKPNIIVENLTENLGGAGGFNYGIRTYMNKTSNEFIWIMDDDTIPENDALEKLLEAANRIKHFSFLSSNIRWIDKSPAKMNIPLVDRKNWTNLIGINQMTYPAIRRATFVSLFVSREIIKEIGLPIKEFFIWGDDSEYTERMYRKRPGYFVSNSIVIHKMKSNQGVSIIDDLSDTDRLHRYFYAYRNRIYYTKFLETQEKVKIRLGILNDLRQIITKSKHNKIMKMKMLITGCLAGVCFNPKIEFAESVKPKNSEEKRS